MATNVNISTNLGNFEIELWEESSPITVANFLEYVDSGYFNGTIFHRVIPDFMIQGGGFEDGMVDKDGNPPIKNEAHNRIPNERGTLAMARTSDINSASSQFFVNLKDNDFLNYQGDHNYGYCVFGRVVNGMDVIDMMADAATTNVGHHGDVPVDTIVMETVSRV